MVMLSPGRAGFRAKTTKVGANMPRDDAGDGEEDERNGRDPLFSGSTTDEARPRRSTAHTMTLLRETQDLLQPLINEGSLKALCGLLHRIFDVSLLKSCAELLMRPRARCARDARVAAGVLRRGNLRNLYCSASNQ